MTDFFQIISAKITAFVTVVMITVTSILPGATSNANKPTDTAIASPSATVSESPLPSISPKVKPSPVSNKPINKQILEKPTPSPSTQVNLLNKEGNRTKELQNEPQKIEQIKQSSPPPPTPTPIPSYADLHCPKVIMFEDNLGNTSTGAGPGGTFKKGSINLLTVKITATDPQNLPLYFQYSYTNFVENREKIGADWSQNNSFTYDVTNAVPGVNKILSVYIDNQDGYRCSGGNYDTAAQFLYNITP